MTERIQVSAASQPDAPPAPSWMREESVTYAQAGVDIEEGARAVRAIKGHVRSTYRPEVVGDIGGFGGLFDVSAAKGMEQPLLVSGTDGVGTKLQIAEIAGRHDTVGVDLVAMCVNDILASGAEPLFFLDYIAIGKLRSEAVSEIVSGIAEGCRQAGCALIGGEMAEHPGVMDPDEYDLSGFAVGIVDRPKMLDPANVRQGDVLLGLASSGLHSNGYSLARKVCTEGRTHYELRLERAALDGASVQDALLEPTRIYVEPVLGALRSFEGSVHALAHITGGGITENLNRALPAHLDARVDVGTWTMKPIIPFVCAAARLSEEEALKTFNMGIGMVLAVEASAADDIASYLEGCGEQVFAIGEVTEGSGKVVYTGIGSLFPELASESVREQPAAPPADERTSERDVFYEEDYEEDGD